MFKLSPEFPDVYKAPEQAGGENCNGFPAPIAAGLSLVHKHVGTRTHSQAGPCAGTTSGHCFTDPHTFPLQQPDIGLVLFGFSQHKHEV